MHLGGGKGGGGLGLGGGKGGGGLGLGGGKSFLGSSQLRVGRGGMAHGV